MIVVSELRQMFPLKFLLKIAHLSRSTYYYQFSKKDKDEKNKDLMQLIAEIFNDNKGCYGFRRITLELRNKGFLVNKKKVRRLMDKLGLKGKRPKMKYHSYQGDLNGTTKNQLLDKIVDEENHKTYYERNFLPHPVMRNGQQMSACFVSRLGNFIFLPSWICTIERSLLTKSQSRPTMLRYKTC